MSKREQILKYLKSGRPLNNLIATKEFGVVGSTLAYSIHKLREAGHNIHTERKQTFSGSSYAEYRLAG